MTSRTCTSRRAATFWWLGFILCCVGFAALKHWLESVRQLDRLEWRNESRLSGCIWNYSLYNIAELRARLGSDNVSSGEYVSAAVTDIIVRGGAIDPRFEKWKVRLTFGGARGTEHLAQWSVIAPPGVADHPSNAWVAVEYARLAMFPVGGITWIASLILMTGGSNIRKSVAPICLAASLACVLSASLAPRLDWELWRKPLESRAWEMLGAAGVMTLISLVLWIIPSRRSKGGVCSKCNYNLTGNVSGVCPECGTETEAARRKKRLAEFSPMAERLYHIEASGPEPQAQLEADDENEAAFPTLDCTDFMMNRNSCTHV